mmetsp:Transcript_51639/g.112204  ORF Transcript_51639/g.112204 Transcript_51639/m.112204 type:complete len:261 (-) Transcript_51639:400-1182(-)
MVPLSRAWCPEISVLQEGRWMQRPPDPRQLPSSLAWTEPSTPSRGLVPLSEAKGNIDTPTTATPTAATSTTTTKLTLAAATGTATATTAPMPATTTGATLPRTTAATTRRTPTQKQKQKQQQTLKQRTTAAAAGAAVVVAPAAAGAAPAAAPAPERSMIVRTKRSTCSPGWNSSNKTRRRPATGWESWRQRCRTLWTDSTSDGSWRLSRAGCCSSGSGGRGSSARNRIRTRHSMKCTSKSQMYVATSMLCGTGSAPPRPA